MYRFVMAAVFCLFSGLTQAQGYVGAVVALSRINGECQGGDFTLVATNYSASVCDHKGRAVKLYAGSQLAKSSQIDLAGVGAVNAVEVSVINFGKGGSNGLIGQFNAGTSSYDPTPASRSSTANALTAAAVANFPLFEGTAFLARVGAAYVSSTVTSYINGVRNSSETATKLKPYIGLGLTYEPVQNVKLVGSFDWTKFDVAGEKSNLKALGLGAEFGF